MEWVPAQTKSILEVSASYAYPIAIIHTEFAIWISVSYCMYELIFLLFCLMYQIVTFSIII